MALNEVNHPLVFRAVKRLGRPLVERELPSLEPVSLMRLAQRWAKLQEFAHDDFSEHLAVAAESAQADANLSILGRVGLRGALANALYNRLLLDHALRERSHLFAPTLIPPVIVLGLPRSGTTFLHRLLALDPAARALPYWQLRRPLAPPGRRDRRLSWARAQTRDFKLLAPDIDAKHLSNAETPEECVFLFDCSLLSATFWVAGPLYGYLDHYKRADHRRAYELYSELLHLFQKEAPQRRLTLKAPGHTMHVEVLRHQLPNAKLIQLHRDPVRATTSVNSLFYTLHQVVTDRLDVPRMARANLDLLASGMQRCVEYRAQHPEHGIVDVYYDDLVADPLATVQKIYAAHELPFTTEYERVLVDYIRAHPQHKHGVHRYASEDFQIPEEELRERFSGYLATFPRLALEGKQKVVAPTALLTRGGLYTDTVERVLAPHDTASAREALQAAVSQAGPRGQVVLVGAGRSFTGHFLPARRPGPKIALTTQKLRGMIEIFEPTAADREHGVLRVRARAGTSFHELLAAVRDRGYYVPASMPSCGSISLGGALAANTHSRTSATYGGLFADQVKAVRLLTASGTERELTPEATGTLERDLWRYLPGSLGALGLVTELELELLRIEPTEIEAQVLWRRDGEHLVAADEYLKLVRENAQASLFLHSEGVGLVFFGHPLHGAAVIMGRSRVAEATRSGLPLFTGSKRRAALLQGLLHRAPRAGQALAAKLLQEGKRFYSEYERWAFFQDSWDQAAATITDGNGAWKLLRDVGVDPKLTVVHQAWVTPTKTVRNFLRQHFELLGNPRYAPLLPHVEFQDMAPLSTGRWPMSPSFEQAEGAHVFALSFAVHQQRAELVSLAQQYCAELSHAAFQRGTVVQLIKQLHCEPTVLRTMYAKPLAELRRLRKVVDPDDMIQSATLTQLGL